MAPYAVITAYGRHTAPRNSGRSGGAPVTAGRLCRQDNVLVGPNYESHEGGVKGGLTATGDHKASALRIYAKSLARQADLNVAVDRADLIVRRRNDHREAGRKTGADFECAPVQGSLDLVAADLAIGEGRGSAMTGHSLPRQSRCDQPHRLPVTFFRVPHLP